MQLSRVEQRKASRPDDMLHVMMPDPFRPPRGSRNHESIMPMRNECMVAKISPQQLDTRQIGPPQQRSLFAARTSRSLPYLDRVFAI